MRGQRTTAPFPWISLLSTVFAIVFLASGVSPAAELKSPDGKIEITFDVKDDGGQSGCMFWSVAYRGKRILADSRLGLVLKDGPSVDSGFEIAQLTSSNHDSTWKPVYGERSTIRDHYRQLVVDLRGARPPRRRLRLTFRAYNEGAAVCYTIPEQDNMRDFVIKAENTQFSFTGNHVTYPVYSAQGEYETTHLDKVKANCERPLTIEIDGGPVLAVAEARLVDYARMRLRPLSDRPHTLVSMLGSTVAASAPYTTPWRVLMVADTPGQLLERNYLILNLNDPCAIEDTSWIKPGKVIREVTLTTAGGKACVDFAVDRGLQYVEFDAGWYGHEYDVKADATTVSVDPERSKGPLDLHDVIDYATARNIGVLVYVNRRHLERQLDEILPLYKSWGIKGVKYGFVQVGSQKWTTWLHHAVRKAAEHELMVDVHDEYRPTGYSRTYPNLMTQEGIRGNECMPTAEHNLILPFTRSLCGAGDYTVCWYSGRVKNTLAHQLGASVVFYSPWQFLFWYDRPQQYRGEPELEFFKHVPTVWDETRVINGKIGHYVTIARRSGREWYIGSLNAVERRELDIPLTFLDLDSKYTAYVYYDGSPEGGNRTNVSVRSMGVYTNTVLQADMAANGGQVVRLVPAGEQ